MEGNISPDYSEFIRFSKDYFSPESHKMVMYALSIADGKLAAIKRYDGSPFLNHSVNTASIVIKEIGLGRNSVISTLLHDVVRLGMMEAAEAGRLFGEPCTGILKGLCDISDVDTKVSDRQADNFRELIVSYSTDPRVILIKLADRLEVMRSLDIFPPQKQAKKSWESIHLYAQIAHKLGLYNIKSELEDLSLRYLEPADYAYITKRLSETAAEREEFIRAFLEPIEAKLTQQSYKYHIKSRTKSIYSIWSKMKRMKIAFDDIFDLFAIRIIIDAPRDQEKAMCWGVFSIVTDFYTPNPDRMRDWISIPKSNGYESLHTTVVTDSGRWVEIQIRTERMNEVAERGVAAHWRYKGVKGDGMGMEEWFGKMRKVMESTHTDSIEERFDAKLSSGEIFIFTPKGDLRKLPEGATLLDFAFDIHTSIGAACTGGKVNHRNVSLKEVLRNGDIVEVLTSKNQRPKADWLNFVVTNKARNKIKAYLREEQAKAASLGREELERKLKNWKLPFTIDEAVTILSRHYKLRTGTELYGRIAQEQILPAEFKEVLLAWQAGEDQVPQKKYAYPKSSKTVGEGNDDVLIIDHSLSDIEYKLAKCCNPIFGDDVFGFTTVSAGITIHRTDCPNARRLKELYPYRVLPATWYRQGAGGTFLATIRLQADDVPGLVAAITEVVTRDMKINIRSMSLNPSGGVLSGLLNIEVTSSQVVEAVIYTLMKIKGVQKVFRVNR